MLFCGIDIGSTITKIVLIDEDENILDSIVRETSPRQRRFANELMKELLSRASIHINDIEAIVATGYGRVNVPFADRTITEITCHAAGVSKIFPDARTIVDIGGQDSKGIRVESGRVLNFVMNDKCAAGTGRFLDVLCETLGISVSELGRISLRSKNPLEISSTCTVFAQQELASYIAKGASLEDIAYGVYKAIFQRVLSMVKRIGIENDVVLTGGVSKSEGIRRVARDELKRVFFPKEPLVTGALGAAILAKKIYLQKKAIDKRKRELLEVLFFKE